MSEPRPVAVIGAGIAGLTAALALARRGISVDLIERAACLEDIGAGLQLSPNATRILIDLGLGPDLDALWAEPDAVRLCDGRTLKTIATVPAGRFARARWHAPYAVIHRADLQATLLAAVRNEPLCRLHLGQTIRSMDPDGVESACGRRPRLIVGADGVRSTVRTHISGHGEARYSGYIAWRWTIAEPPPGLLFDRRFVTACLGRRAHLVLYPLGGRRGFNLVAIVNDPGGQSPADLPDGSFSQWHEELRGALPSPGIASVWPLHEVSDGRWHDGERVLIGDAAHAMMPFAAQGAAMAIEDGYELAGTVSQARAGADLAGALDAFVARRRARVARVRSRGAFNRFAYHAGGPVRLGRDLVLSLRTPERRAADFDWLYGYEPAFRSPSGSL